MQKGEFRRMFVCMYRKQKQGTRKRRVIDTADGHKEDTDIQIMYVRKYKVVCRSSRSEDTNRDTSKN